MTVTQSIATHTVDGDAQALFEEARRRRRRRRRLVAAVTAGAVVVAVVAALAAGGGANGPGPTSNIATRGRPGGAPGDQSAGERAVASVALPARYSFDQVAAAGRNLFLTGTVVSASSATTCVAALMDPRTLEIGTVAEGSCDDPALWRQSVLPVSAHPDDGKIAVARLDTRTATVSTGPTVMTYSYSSDTQDLETYGGGWLWIYDVATTNGPEVLQISAATGQVTDTVTVPPLYRPLLVADDDGLWLGNTVAGDPMASAIWHVAPGARSAVGVGPPSRFVFWMVGAQGHLWAGIGEPGFTHREIWRFDGPTATVAFDVPDHYLTTGVVGSEADGLWAAVADPPVTRVIRSRAGTWISPGQNRREDIVGIDPDTGHETVVHAIAPAPALPASIGTVKGQSAYLDGSLFILQSSSRNDVSSGYRILVRVKT